MRQKPKTTRIARKKLAALAVRPLSFVEVRKASGAITAEPFEVVIASGERIRFPSSFDAPSLERLPTVLERRG